MVGDIGFILPGILDAKLYSDAGVTTYAYYLGYFNPRIQIIIGKFQILMGI